MNILIFNQSIMKIHLIQGSKTRLHPFNQRYVSQEVQNDQSWNVCSPSNQFRSSRFNHNFKLQTITNRLDHQVKNDSNPVKKNLKVTFFRSQEKDQVGKKSEVLNEKGKKSTKKIQAIRKKRTKQTKMKTHLIGKKKTIFGTFQFQTTKKRRHATMQLYNIIKGEVGTLKDINFQAQNAQTNQKNQNSIQRIQSIQPQEMNSFLDLVVDYNYKSEDHQDKLCSDQNLINSNYSKLSIQNIELTMQSEPQSQKGSNYSGQYLMNFSACKQLSSTKTIAQQSLIFDQLSQKDFLQNLKDLQQLQSICNVRRRAKKLKTEQTNSLYRSFNFQPDSRNLVNLMLPFRKIQYGDIELSKKIKYLKPIMHLQQQRVSKEDEYADIRRAVFRDRTIQLQRSR